MQADSFDALGQVSVVGRAIGFFPLDVVEVAPPVVSCDLLFEAGCRRGDYADAEIVSVVHVLM